MMVLTIQTEYLILCYVQIQRKCRLQNIYAYLKKEAQESVRISITERQFINWIDVLVSGGHIEKVQKKRCGAYYLKITDKGLKKIEGDKEDLVYLDQGYKVLDKIKNQRIRIFLGLK